MYTAEISSPNPSAIFFLIDQSASMADSMDIGKSKASFVADVLNRTIYQLITRNTEARGIKERFQIAIFTYGEHGVASGLPSTTDDPVFHTLSSLNNTATIGERTKRVPDNAGGLVDERIQFPYWFTPMSAGGTPMNEAMHFTAKHLDGWCQRHPNAYPPTVIHVTDGEWTDADPSASAALIKSAGTADGPCLLFNLHISSMSGEALFFPNSPQGLDEYGRQLFAMSSTFPPPLIPFAKKFAVNEQSRFFSYKAGYAEIVDFFDIGTKPANAR